MLAGVGASPTRWTSGAFPKNTAFGLTIQTWPLACSEPSNCVAPGPRIRLSAIEALPGCWKTTLFPREVEKLDHSKMALSVDCRMSVVVGLGALTLPWPAATVNPAGCADAA